MAAPALAARCYHREQPLGKAAAGVARPPHPAYHPLMSQGPQSTALGAELVSLMRAELELCRVEAGQVVLVLSDPKSNANYAAAFFGAAHALDAEVFQIVAPLLQSSRNARTEAIAPVVEAMKRVDVVVDLTVTGMLYSDAQRAVRAAGTRILRVREPEDSLRRLFPSQAAYRRVVEGGALLAAGRSLHITSAAGTDLRLEKGTRPAHLQYGYADDPGRWDHWPSAMVACAPLEDSAEGELVLSPGDTILPLWRYIAEPVHLTFHQGRVTDVRGGIDALLLRDYLESRNDPQALQTAHIGWGCEDRADWSALGLKQVEGGGRMDVMCAYGNMLIALGANSDLGGANTTRVHVDIPTRGHDFYVDGQAVLVDGKFQVPGLQ